MNTTINLTYNDEKFTLEFDRTTIKMLEKAGFKYEEFLEKPMTNIELAFTAAFIKNHPNTKQTTIDEIFEGCKDKNKLIAVISKMINDCYESLLSEPEDDSKNVQWEVMDLTPAKKEKVQK